MKLDQLQSTLNGRRSSVADDFTRMAVEKTIDSIVERMGTPHVSPDDLEAGLAKVMESLERLVSQVGGIERVSIDPVLTAVAGLRSDVVKMAKAISSVKLPEVKIPEPASVDLSPVLMEQARLLEEVLALKRAEVSEPAKSWKFDVKRNQAGLIRSIEATEE